MPRQYFDDFIKLTLPKMAQAISDMTYNYKETKVPAKHYKEALSTGYEEMVEANVSVKLVDTIYNVLSGLEKESPRLFYQALLLLDTGVKPNSLTAEQYQAMTVTADRYEQQKAQSKRAHMLEQEAHDIFNDVLKNGVLYRIEKNSDEGE
ncbi:hypothetical protein HAU32_11060 [Weissella confusa]|uniref:Uncharacterized protein n=1 Tax=Weissella fermenti TaxID=2987699 RepID=A0ABT6D4Z6_9LACO|nr:MULTISPECIES: hypothetical protein [Weissella]MBJ7689478.1 hypothetical protein [Weissella confusa]MCW0928001.1 hypothetical protein [Weissella sp. LMG 11983]MDF9300591.1 hypothetical protein [Weissella sp. BK2]